MSSITIRTNNVPRSVIYGYELTEKERAEFDYLEDIDNAQFFRFKGSAYDIGEFSRIIATGSKRCHPMESDNPAFAGWAGYLSDSFFSGVLIKWVGSEFESLVVGQYFS
jgi:hypothetical protein